MKIAKKLLMSVLAVAALSSAGSAMALSQANVSAFYANNQISFSYGISGNKAMAAYFCEKFLTLDLPNPNEPDVPATRTDLRNMCLRWVQGLPNRSSGGSIGPFNVWTFPF